MYKDTQLKKDFLLDRVMQELMQSGEGTSRQYALEKIDDIDLYLSLVREDLVQPGSKLDVERINELAGYLQGDIDILFQVLDSLTQNCRALEAECRAELRDIAGLAESCRSRAGANLSVPGREIFFQNRGFAPQKDGNVFRFDLGEVSMRPGAILVLQLPPGKSGQLRFSNARRSFALEEDAPVRAPGELKLDKIEDSEIVKILENQKVDRPVAVLEDPDPGAVYHILAGSAHWNHEKDGPCRFGFEEKALFEQEGLAQAYVYNASHIQVSSNKELLAKNYNGDMIEPRSPIKKLSIKNQAQDEIDVQTDGQVFGAHYQGQAIKGRLFCPATPFRDIIILKEDLNDKETFQAFLETEEDQLDFVSIKELGGIIS